MAWLGLCDHTERRLSLQGLGLDRAKTPLLRDHPDTLLARGSILFETRLSPDGRPQVLFAYKSTGAQMRSLTFQAIPGGGISMVQVQGDRIAHAAVKLSREERIDTLRLTYAWDCQAGAARLTLEKPEGGCCESVMVADPLPLNLADIRALILGQGDQTFASDMIFAALSNQVEPIGPTPALVPSTPVATPWGYKPANSLRRGDTVTTRDEGVVPVLQTVQRSVPARGSFQPLRLRAPYFGLRQDIIVGPEQRLIIDGPEVEYLFGQEAVLVPARHLDNGFAALQEPCGPVIRYAQLLLPRHERLMAAGAALESLYVGRLRRDIYQLKGSLLHSYDRSLLPEHPKPAHQVLRWYDAIHLARRRAG